MYRFYLFLLLNISFLFSQGANKIDISGNWTFHMDPIDIGITQNWQTREFTDTVSLPGTNFTNHRGFLNAQEPSLEISNQPFLTYNYTYNGPAWYKRIVEIPEAMANKPLRLAMERVLGKSRLWIDGDEIGDVNISLSTPHEYFIKQGLSAGEHVITLRIDNSWPCNKNEIKSEKVFSKDNFVQGNGAIGSLFLEELPIINIDDVIIAPDVEKLDIEALLYMQNYSSNPIQTKIAVSVGKNRPVSVTKTLQPGENIVTCNYQMPKNTSLWNEHTPEIYSLNIVVSAPNIPKIIRSESFGMRQINHDGTHLKINGNPVMLRGTVMGEVFPQSATIPMYETGWAKIFFTAKNWGLNHLRFNGWCPPETAFKVADRMGFYIQIDFSKLGKDISLPTDDFISQEIDRIARSYGNHPSLCVVTTDSLRDMKDDYPFFVTTEQKDLIDKIVGSEMFPNLEEIHKYGETLSPSMLFAIEEDVKEKNLINQSRAWFLSSGAKAMQTYKKDIEKVVLNDSICGFQLIGLEDYPDDEKAFVGMLDAFWDSKGIVAPAIWRQFCSPVVVLADFDKNVYNNGETFCADIKVNNFSLDTIHSKHVMWEIVNTTTNQSLGEGRLRIRDFPNQELSSVGEIRHQLLSIVQPVQAELRVWIDQTNIRNTWNIWVFPYQTQQQLEKEAHGIVLTKDWVQAQDALAQGQKVLFSPWSNDIEEKGVGINSALGMICNPDHPALASFPTQFYAEGQWDYLLKDSLALDISDISEAKPIVWLIDDYRKNRRLSPLFEVDYEEGKLIVSTIPLWGETLVDIEHPERSQLLLSILRYMQK